MKIEIKISKKLYEELLSKADSYILKIDYDKVEMIGINEGEIKSMTKDQNYMRVYKDSQLDILDKIRK